MKVPFGQSSREIQGSNKPDSLTLPSMTIVVYIVVLERIEDESYSRISIVSMLFLRDSEQNVTGNNRRKPLPVPVLYVIQHVHPIGGI